MAPFRSSMEKLYDAYACLGVITVPVAPQAAHAGKAAPAQSGMAVDSYLLLVTSCAVVGSLGLTHLIRITGVDLICLGRGHIDADGAPLTRSKRFILRYIMHIY